MKILLVLAVLCISSFVRAETTVRFQPGDAGVAVIVHGMDSDASRLYEAMKVDVEDDRNVLKKNVFLTRMKEPILDLTCVKSKMSEATTCTLHFIPGILTTINLEQGIAKFEVIDSYAAPRVANLFVSPKVQGPDQMVFESANKKLKFWRSLSAYGQVASFTVEYAELD